VIDFSKTDLLGANLNKANLKEVDLSEADLEGADLFYANLEGVNLWSANLEGAKNLTVEQLSKVKTLYEAKLDKELMEKIQKKKYQHLLENPKIMKEEDEDEEKE
ncbi:MAG: pentapeptide repeat-containing protein, partial [Thermodesulfobacteriota bacterium]